MAGLTAITIFISTAQSELLIDYGTQTGISKIEIAKNRIISVGLKSDWTLWDKITRNKIKTGSGSFTKLSEKYLASSDSITGVTSIYEVEAGNLVFTIQSAIDTIVFSPVDSYFWCRLKKKQTVQVYSTIGKKLLEFNDVYNIAALNLDSNFFYINSNSFPKDSLSVYSLTTMNQVSALKFEGIFKTWYLDGSKFITLLGSGVSFFYDKNGAKLKFLEKQVSGGTANFYWIGNTVYSFKNDSAINIFPNYKVLTPKGTTSIYNDTLAFCEFGSDSLFKTYSLISNITNTLGTEVSKLIIAVDSNFNWALATPSGLLFDHTTNTNPYYQVSLALGQPISIASNDKHLAIAFKSGNIIKYTLSASRIVPIDTFFFKDSIAGISLSTSPEFIVVARDTFFEMYQFDNNELSFRCKRYKNPSYDWAVSYSGSFIREGQIIRDFKKDTIIHERNGYISFAPTTDNLYLSRDETQYYPIVRVYQNNSLINIIEGYSSGWVNDSLFTIFKTHGVNISKDYSVDKIDNVFFSKLDGTKIPVIGLDKIASGKTAPFYLERLTDSLVLFRSIQYINTTQQTKSFIYNFYTFDTLNSFNFNFQTIGKKYGLYSNGNRLEYFDLFTPLSIDKPKRKPLYNTKGFQIVQRNHDVYLHFAIRPSTPLSVEIYNLHGKKIFSQKNLTLYSNLLKLPVSLCSQTYIIRLVNGQETFTQSINYINPM